MGLSLRINLSTTQRSDDEGWMSSSLSDWWNLSTTKYSVYGLGMGLSQRSREARLQQQQQRVEKKFREAIRMQQLVEKEDEMNLLTSQKSDDGGWMEDYLRSRKAIRLQQQLQRVEKELSEDIMQLVEINDWMNLSSTQKSDDGGWRRLSLRSLEERLQQQQQRVEKKFREATRIHQLVEMEDWMNFRTSQKSDDGGWMNALQRSRKARLQQQLQRVEKELSEDIMQLVEINDWMNLSSTQKSDDGGWMSSFLRDWMNLRTSQKSDDRGWMEDYLRSRKARLQQQLQRVDKELREAIMQLLEINDGMNLSSTHKSDDGGWMSSFLRPELQKPELQRPDGSKVMEPRERNGSGVRIKHQSMEAIITFKEEQPPPWDGMNLLTTLQSVVGAGM